MKPLFATTIIVLASTFPMHSLAASDHGGHDGHGAMPAHASTAAQPTDGLVKKVDKAAGKVTLKHGPLPHLGMDMPMTMVFRVKDAAWLEQMKEGDKIRFVADKVNGVFTIIQFELAK